MLLKGSEIFINFDMPPGSMAEKTYATDWAKQKSRDLVREMIAGTLLKFRRPQDLRVLCLPGIDAAEIFEVYDRLGIPRENIVGVERESDIAEAIEGKDLRIKVERQDLEDYVKDLNPAPFDIISLDFTGPLNLKILHAISTLASRETKNHVLFHIANSIRRDSQFYQVYELGYATSKFYGVNPARRAESTFNDILEYVEGGIDQFRTAIGEQKPIKEEKEAAHSTLVKAAISNGLESLNGALVSLKFFAQEEYPQALGYLKQALELMGMKDPIVDDGKFVRIRLTYENMPLFSVEAERLLYYYANACLMRHEIFCTEKKGINPAAMVLTAVVRNLCKEGKFFTRRDASLYSYISETGTPMTGCIYFGSYPERKMAVAQDIAAVMNFPEAFRLKTTPQKFAALLRDYQRQRLVLTPEEVSDMLHEKESNRIFLGNSAKPILTKQRAIEEFRQGATIDSIRGKYRLWEGKPLAQWRAHFTMGTYDQIPADQLPEDDTLERITKDDAINLLSSAIPPEEIFETYPTSFSIGQLRAFKAGVKRGAYKSNGSNGAEAVNG